jgi:hypothetical protein
MQSLEAAKEYMEYYGLQITDLHYLKVYDVNDLRDVKNFTRIKNVFEKYNIKNLFDLIDNDPADFKKFRDLGDNSIHDIRLWAEKRKGVFLKDSYEWKDSKLRELDLSTISRAPNFYTMQNNIVEWVRDGNILAREIYPDRYERMRKTISLTPSVDPSSDSAEQEKSLEEKRYHEKQQEIFAIQKMQTYFAGKEDILATEVSTLDSPLTELQDNGIFIVAEVAYNNVDWFKEKGVALERIPMMASAMQNLGFEHGIGYHDLAINEYWSIQEMKHGAERSRLEYGVKMGLKLG